MKASPTRLPQKQFSTVNRTNLDEGYTDTQLQGASLESSSDLTQIAPHSDNTFKPANLLKLQQTIGNRAVQRLINDHRNNPQTAQARHGFGCSCHSGLSGAAQRTLVKESTKKEQQDVQRLLTLGMTHTEMIQQLMASAKDRKLVQYIPSTGMGRFDAEYDPMYESLYITVRPFIQFGQATNDAFTPGGWSDEEQKKFKDDFRAQCESAWSGKFTFRCTKSGFRTLKVIPEVRVEFAKNLKEGHFDVKLSKNKVVNTGIGREQSGDPTGKTKNVGNFGAQDAPERPHDSASTRCNMASHDIKRINELIIAYNVGKIHLNNGGAIKTEDKTKLASLAAAVKKSSLPGSVPVPLIATGSNSDFFNNETKALASANKVKTFLESSGLDKNPVKVRSTKAVIKAEETAHNKNLADYAVDERTGYKPGGRYEKEAMDKITDLKAHRKEKRVDLEMDFGFAQTWQGDPYSILAHEFGHMLGNPDEYFKGGEEVFKQRIASLTTAAATTGDADKDREAKKLKALHDEGKGFETGGDKERYKIQERYGALVTAAGLEVQTFDPSPTASIMSAGANVLPQHYVPMWEALGKITEPVLQKEDWKIS